MTVPRRVALAEGENVSLSLVNSNVNNVAGDLNIVNNYFNGQSGHGLDGWERQPEQTEDVTSVKNPEGGCRLTDNIFVYTDSPLSKKTNVYDGCQVMRDCCNRALAIKYLRRSEKTMGEAKILLILNQHINVVQIIHADFLPSDLEGRIYIAMERCKSLTLEDYIKDRRKRKIPFCTVEALDFARQLIEGLNHIHSKSIIHRDIKPSNVLFSLHGNYLKIIDFGLGKELVKGRTKNSLSSKTGIDGFRAPETYNQNENNQKSDVFSLGILLYYIWSYKNHPFGEERLRWGYNIMKWENFGLDKLLIPNEEMAKDILLKMMENDDKKRYSIQDVKKHRYITEGIGHVLTSDMKQVWSGAVKVMSGSDVESPYRCILYERKGQNLLDLRKNSAQLRMLYLPRAGIDDVLESINLVPPNGYLAVSKHVYQKRMQGMFTAKMGWINAFRGNKRIGTFVVFQPKDFKEVIAIFIENPVEFLNRFRSMAANNTKTPGSESKADEDETRNKGQAVGDGAEQAPHLSQSATEGHELSRAAAEDPWSTSSTDEDSPDIEDHFTVTQCEYISWWVYDRSRMQPLE